MYAIVDIAGQQFKVEKNQKIFVHRVAGQAGSKVDFDKVLLIENDKNVTVGAPVIEGAMVYASILDQIKGDKVLVFKKKRKKGYRKLNGHRQSFTQILIEDIIEKDAKRRIVEEKVKPAKAKKTAEEIIIPVEGTVSAAETPKEKAFIKKPIEKKTTTVPGEKKAGKADTKTAAGKTSEKKQPAVKKSVAPKKASPAEKPAKENKAASVKKPATKKTK